MFIISLIESSLIGGGFDARQQFRPAPALSPLPELAAMFGLTGPIQGNNPGADVPVKQSPYSELFRLRMVGYGFA
jgi:hypothetical protein